MNASSKKWQSLLAFSTVVVALLLLFTYVFLVKGGLSDSAVGVIVPLIFALIIQSALIELN